jgi:hypothetical protein
MADYAQQYQVQFKGIGKKPGTKKEPKSQARLSVQVARDHRSLDDYGAQLTCATLDVRLTFNPSTVPAVQGQLVLVPENEIIVETKAETGKLTVGVDRIDLTLVVPEDEIVDLWRLGYVPGTMESTRTGDASKKDGEED